MSCGYCQSTQVTRCPVCDAGAERIAPKPSNNPARVTVQLPEWVRAYRLARANRQYNVCCALLIGNADPARKALRITVLMLIDENAARRGTLTAQDDALRTKIAKTCIAEIGFDPKSDHACPAVTTPAAMPRVVIDAPKALPEGPKDGALVSGDWADLYRRVKAGQLTDAEATQIAQTWTGQASA